MTRTPNTDPAPVVLKKDDQTITQVREYKLITPLFGGGVVPAEADPVTVIRGTEIRGHLRFWWRATRGGGFEGDLAKMKAAEDALWGAASTPQKPSPSRVQIAVEFIDPGERMRDPLPRSRYGYVTFPLEGQQRVREGVSFKLTLTIHYPPDADDKKKAEMTADVEAALWTWETFGGIGARTRRGFGALQCLSVTVDGKKETIKPPAANELRQAIRDGITRHVVNGQWPKDVPHLIRMFKVVSNPSPKAVNWDTPPPWDVPAAWRYLIHQLRDFRQHRNGTFGRSHWPESDEIRRLVRHHSHAPRFSIDKFPRAVFGLPIVFQFIGGRAGIPGADPAKITLQGRQSSFDRLASPLILRPIACDNDQAVGLAVILVAPFPPPTGLMLKGEEGTFLVKDDSLDPSEATTISPLSGNPDVLEAFLKTL